MGRMAVVMGHAACRTSRVHARRLIHLDLRVVCTPTERHWLWPLSHCHALGRVRRPCAPARRAQHHRVSSKSRRGRAASGGRIASLVEYILCRVVDVGVNA